MKTKQKMVKRRCSWRVLLGFGNLWNQICSQGKRARINEEIVFNRIDSDGRFFQESIWSFIGLVKKGITIQVCVNWGEGNRWQMDLIELKKDLIWGSYPTCTACSHWANIAEAIHRSLGTTDDPKRSDRSWTSTGSDRDNSRAHGYRP